ncbi:MAG: 23S rRNA (pseudouridine(1915)-N(3))-methyltransferase RlmH [Bacteroidales bacterium]|jgi:23S rRNA (pseudouridine1915-N3)-methyltransferase
MKIILLQTGKTGEKYISDGVEEYSSRIRKYAAFEMITIPDLKNTKSMPVEEQKAREGKLILQSLGNDDYVIVLDEKGKELTTMELASLMEKIFQMPKKRAVFVIGGPWGFSGEVYERADLRMSLSRLTFSHQLVRLLFAEQLYRVLTVIKGTPYHHE